MRVMKASRLLPLRLIVSLLLISLLTGAVSCSSEDDSRMWQPAKSASEERRDAEENEPEDVDEEHASEIEVVESDGEASGERQEDVDEDEERTEAVATPTPEPDRGIARSARGISRGGGFADGVLALLPGSDDLRDLVAFDVRGIRTTEVTPAALHAELEESYGFLGSSYCIRLDEVEAIVSAGRDKLLVKGEFSKEELRALLEFDGYENETYRGYELWVESESGAIAVFEERMAILIGREDSVRQVLKDLNRGNESFLARESRLRTLYDKTRDGLKLRLKSVCSGDYCLVLATAAMTAASEDEYAVDIELVAMTVSEDTALEIREDLRATVDQSSYIEVLDISDSVVDEFVIVRATIDEESVEGWGHYSVPYSIFAKPSGAVAAPAAPVMGGSDSSVPEQRECPPSTEGS